MSYDLCSQLRAKAEEIYSEKQLKDIKIILTI